MRHSQPWQASLEKSLMKELMKFVIIIWNKLVHRLKFQVQLLSTSNKAKLFKLKITKLDEIWEFCKNVICNLIKTNYSELKNISDKSNKNTLRIH